MIFAVFREVRKGCYSRMPLNFRVQMARGGGLRAKKGDVHCAAWPTDPQKTLDFLRKTSSFGKPLFCIQRWLGSCLETSSGRLGATPTGPGGVSPRIGPHPCDSGPEESHKVSGWQNETPMVPERVTQICFFPVRV